MGDQLLLRFRDLTPNLKTIDEHNKIVEDHGRCLWGWWKKPLESLPDSGFAAMTPSLGHESANVLLIDSGERSLYRAPLRSIHYQPGGPLKAPPDESLCPEYYKKKKLPAWFELGRIEEIKEGLAHLDEYLWSPSNRSARTATSSALPESWIGQGVRDHVFLNLDVSLWFVRKTEDAGIRSRGRTVIPVSRTLWPVSGRYVLHISDLHFGPKHSFRPQLKPRKGPNIAKDTLVEALIQDLEALNIKDRGIALLLVTGDLAWSGDPHEFENARAALEELGRKLGLHISQIVIVPGNHDIEWLRDRKAIDDSADLNYKNFCQHFYGVTPSGSFLRIHRFRAGRPITVIALNSCRIESEENAGLGFIGKEQLGEAHRFLKDLDTDKNELRIALLHHHLVPVNYVEDLDWESKRTSLTLDAEAVVRELIAMDVRVVFHGHQHQPFFAEERRIVQDHVGVSKRRGATLDGTIAVIGGGSLGVDRSHLNLIGRNAYNLIDLEGPRKGIEVTTRVASPTGPGFVEYQKVHFRI